MKRALLLILLLGNVIILNAQTVNIGDSIYTSNDNGNTLQLSEVEKFNYNPQCLDTLFHVTYFNPVTNAATNSQTFYSYNPDGTVHQSILQNGSRSDNTYINSTRTTFTYTSAQGVSTILTENWNGSSWSPTTFERYSKNTSGKDTVDLTQVWNDARQAFANQNKVLYFYNAGGLLTKLETESWDTTSNSWILVYLNLRTYDQNGYMIASSDQDVDTSSGQYLHFDTLNYYNNSKGWADSSVERIPYNKTLQKNYYTYYSTGTPKQYTGYIYQDSALLSIRRVDYIQDTLNNVLSDTTITQTAGAPYFTLTPNIKTTSRFIFDQDNNVKNFTYSSFSYNNSIPVENFYQTGNVYYSTCSSALPLTLLNFTATQKNKDAIVQWQTANETNVSYYNVLRSTDGIHFTIIGKVWASGNGFGEEDYTYTDANIGGRAAAKLYYRLAGQDRNGTVIYSKIVELDMIKEALSVSISPNPIQNTVLIYSTATLSSASITITDINGSKLYTSHQNIAAGSKLAIDASRFTKGTYFIIIQSSTGKQVFKVIK